MRETELGTTALRVTPIGLGLAALGRPGYINLGHGDDLRDRTVDGMERAAHQVLDLIGSGATNREIAEQLYLSPHTVKEHTSSLYRKLSVRNRAEAVQKAQRLGLIS